MATKRDILRLIVTFLFVAVVYQNVSMSFSYHSDPHRRYINRLERKGDNQMKENLNLSAVEPELSTHKGFVGAAEPILLKFAENSPRVGVISYIPYKPDQHFTIEFKSLLYSSWKYVMSHPHLASSVNILNYTLPNELVLVDLLIWCAEKACKELPIDCQKYQHPYLKKLTPQCLYFPKEEHPESAVYGWINSFQYAMDPVFPNLTHNFNYFIRLDTDTLLAPGVLVWLPANDVAMGLGGYYSEFAFARLEKIAKKLNLTNQKVHLIGSTLYTKSHLTQALGAEIIRLTFYLYKNEFNPKLPGLEGLFKDNPEGIWPTWWRPVSTMYASELALNAIVPNLTNCWTQDLLDQQACNYSNNILTTLQLHCYQSSCQFRKFDFMEAVMNVIKTGLLDPRLFRFYNDRDVANMSLRDYTIFIAWHGAANYVQQIQAWVNSSLGQTFVNG